MGGANIGPSFGAILDKENLLPIVAFLRAVGAAQFSPVRKRGVNRFEDYQAPGGARLTGRDEFG